MRLPTSVKVLPIVSDGEPVGEFVTIVADKSLGGELALALMRLEQTTLHIPESIRDLRLRLDCELVGDPHSRQYVKRQGEGR